MGFHSNLTFCLLLLSLGVGCSDFGLQSIPGDPSGRDEGDDDSGADLIPHPPEDSEETPEPAPEPEPDPKGGDDAPPFEEDDDPTPCPTFAWTWNAPFSPAVISVEGAIETLDGIPMVPWQLWAVDEWSPSVGFSAAMCPPFRFRGEGIADFQDDGTDDAWSCTWLGDVPGNFALVGDVECSVDGDVIEAGPIADPLSQGCGVLCVVED
jgi:hypothetical protein